MIVKLINDGNKLIVPYDKIRLINLNIVKIFSDLIILGDTTNVIQFAN